MLTVSSENLARALEIATMAMPRRKSPFGAVELAHARDGHLIEVVATDLNTHVKVDVEVEDDGKTGDFRILINPVTLTKACRVMGPFDVSLDHGKDRLSFRGGPNGAQRGSVPCTDSYPPFPIPTTYTDAKQVYLSVDDVRKLGSHSLSKCSDLKIESSGMKISVLANDNYIASRNVVEVDGGNETCITITDSAWWIINAAAGYANDADVEIGRNAVFNFVALDSTYRITVMPTEANVIAPVALDADGGYKWQAIVKAKELQRAVQSVLPFADQSVILKISQGGELVISAESEVGSAAASITAMTDIRNGESHVSVLPKLAEQALTKLPSESVVISGIDGSMHVVSGGLKCVVAALR